MILSKKLSFRDSAIDTLDLIDMFPISSGLKPNCLLPPYVFQTFCIIQHVYTCMMKLDLYFLWLMEQSGVQLLRLVQKRHTWITALPNCRTGQSLLLLVLFWVLDLNFYWDFWSLNRIHTYIAMSSNLGWLCDISVLSSAKKLGYLLGKSSLWVLVLVFLQTRMITWQKRSPQLLDQPRVGLGCCQLSILCVLQGNLAGLAWLPFRSSCLRICSSLLSGGPSVLSLVVFLGPPFHEGD